MGYYWYKSGIHKCEICGRTCKSLLSLAKHIPAHNFSIDDYLEKYTDWWDCVDCGKKKDSYKNKFCLVCRKVNNKLCNMGRTQTPENINKRINATDQIAKEISRKHTMIKKYGTDNYTKIPGVRTEISKRVIEEYKKGKRCIALGKSFSRGKSGYYKEIYYRSSYELKLMIFLDKLKIEYNQPKYIKYVSSSGKIRHYFPDFYLPHYNLIIEVKSSYYMDKDPDFTFKWDAALQEGYNYFIYDEEWLEDDVGFLNELKDYEITT